GGEVAVEAEDFREQLGAKTVHHRHHDDERRHAERHADQGQRGDDRDEGVAAARAQIAPRQHPFEARKRAGGGGRLRGRGLGQTLSRLSGSIAAFNLATTASIGKVSRSPVLRFLISATPSLRPRGPRMTWYGVPIKSAVANFCPAGWSRSS